MASMARIFGLGILNRRKQKTECHGQYGLDGRNGWGKIEAVVRVRLILKIVFFITEVTVLAIALGVGKQFNSFQSPYAVEFLVIAGISLFALPVLSLCLFTVDKKLTVVGFLTFIAVFIRPLYSSW